MPRVLFGISGSIAAYKALEVIRGLRRLGVTVIPLMSKGAEAFVTPLSVSVLAEHEVFTDHDAMSRMPHITLGREADLLVICPASADTLAKCRWGTTDTLLTATWSAFAGPKLVFPAMHTAMYQNPATQENLTWLQTHGAHVFGPVSGDLACGDRGLGRMVDPALALSTITHCLALEKNSAKSLALADHNILITAGGTRESLDAVRYIGNRSSGQLGHALARIASFHGAKVCLITTVPLPYEIPGVTEIHVQSTADMAAAVTREIPQMDTLIMAAAVADFTTTPNPSKIKREGPLSLDLQPTIDILQTTPRHKGLKVIGFCLEDGDMQQVGEAKMQRKNTDVMVCNNAASFGAAIRSVMILEKEQPPKTITGDVDSIAKAILEQA
jgi:phosphopantothenoylcysteine decarboxylase/phosphopantothenate--cysteine ligase